MACGREVGFPSIDPGTFCAGPGRAGHFYEGRFLAGAVCLSDRGTDCATDFAFFANYPRWRSSRTASFSSSISRRIRRYFVAMRRAPYPIAMKSPISRTSANNAPSNIRPLGIWILFYCKQGCLASRNRIAAAWLPTCGASRLHSAKCTATTGALRPPAQSAECRRQGARGRVRRPGRGVPG